MGVYDIWQLARRRFSRALAQSIRPNGCLQTVVADHN